ILTALARVPADRFASALEFRDALVRGAGAGTLAPAARAPRRPWRPKAVALGGLAGLLAVAAAALVLVDGGGPRAAPAAASASLPGIAVLPFRALGAEAEVWHEGVVHLLSHNLEDVGQLRKVDPVTVLTEWNRL